MGVREHGAMTKPDPYSHVALGVECAWAPTAAPRALRAPRLRRLLAALALALGLAACASPYAPEEFHFTALTLEPLALPALAAGVVELVEPLDRRDPHALLHEWRAALEHRANPEPMERLHIRLDSGAALTVVQPSPRLYRAGERVRVLAAGPRVHVELQ